jgi:hypothetical protein
MEEKQGGIIKAWWTEVVMQCTGNGGDGNHWGVTRWGERRPWCAPCASLSGQRRKEGMRFARPGGVRATGPQRKRKRGGPVRGRERESRADTGAGIRGAYSATRRGECGTTPWSRENGTRGPHHKRRPQGTQ